MLEVHQECQTQCPVVHRLLGSVLPGLQTQIIAIVTDCVHQVAGTTGQTRPHHVEGIILGREFLAGIVVVAVEAPGEIGLIAIGERETLTIRGR